MLNKKIVALAANCGYVATSFESLRCAHAARLVDSPFVDQHDMRLSESLGLNGKSKTELRRIATSMSRRP